MYLDPTDASVRRLFQRRIEGPVTMLNLLRFREWADYTGFPTLAPPAPISGREAYDRYIAHTLPFLSTSGGAVRFLGAGGPNLVGPEDERWDLVMLVHQAGVAAFLAFAADEEYLAGLGHRTAALEDSRLVPLVELHIPGEGRLPSSPVDPVRDDSDG